MSSEILIDKAIEEIESNGGKDLIGNCYMHVACQFNDIEKIHKYLRENHPVDAENNFKKTPLHIACFTGNLEIVKILVENGADINHQDDFGNSPIHVCAAVGTNEVGKYLIDEKADLSLRDIYGCSVLHQCAVVNNYELAQLLLKHIFVDVVDKFYNTPLTTACSCGSAEIALLFARHGANINHKNMYGASPVETIREITSRVA